MMFYQHLSSVSLQVGFDKVPVIILAWKFLTLVL